MKKIFLISLLLSANAFAGKIPSSWLSNTLDISESMKSIQNMKMAENAVDKIFQAGVMMLPENKDDKKSKWFLQSIMMEIGAEKEGNIGLLGAGGEAAVELVWTKAVDPNRGKKLNTNEEVVPTEVKISSEMNVSDIEKEVKPILDLAMASGKIKNRQFLKENLLKRAFEFQKVIRELENTPSFTKWYVYKYQLDLNVSGEGHVTPIFEVGMALRFKMEWWKIAKKTQTKNWEKSELSDNAKFVMGIAQDLETFEQVKLENDFKFNTVKIGLGVGVEGELVVAKGQANAIGSIFFLKNEKATNTKFKMDLPTLHQNFKRGLVKAGKIAQFFTARAPNKEEKGFKLNVIEMEFQYFMNGSLGLVTVEGISVIQLFVTRNVII